ncbi:hypothetical protein JKP75_03005 [Blastococcus sp. TML/M2B]|uniref:hypothetical protein n=1 Tax=unclassified Blastococcus TaxID=2619396 RepID=UPI00190D1648|nr:MULTISPECIES: hypothetical protein [unclassified Blastococcus]MBN1091631.1 hypothetical protein [Blastococcus sp. TML/M2B]MBN1094813.1 hypothetical protein [Blastococcus sp. TML/C7B]
MTGFGSRGAASLLQRLRPTRIGVADLLEVATAVLPSMTGPDLRVELVRRTAAGSVVVVEEDERTLRVDLEELADDMTRAGVAATPEAMAAALGAWVERRPVTDAAAAAAGVAVLDWADAVRSAVGWRVVVRRGDVALPWSPGAGTGADRVRATRAAAALRSGSVELVERVEGPVAIWSHPVVPSLATTVLAAPDRLRARIAATGLPVDDLHAVVTPHRPLACAGGSVAARLAGETPEVSVTLPWARLADLRWL